VSRDPSLVTLNDASRNVTVILDLSQRKVFLAGGDGSKRPLFPIVDAAAK